MSKHTPGPWHVGGPNKCTIYDKHGQRLANSFEGVMATQRTDSECEANARLIAAAPDLLEALIAMEREKSDYMTRNNLGDPAIETTNKLARAAIAKATA
ncbi:hypothetical protein [Pseudomonas aeruginosa]|uniref:hypothetical protein n=1 Tax=Pseudomonas aeruginosa TaxID=287 RepID=UPI00071C1994|nr:hypothetical protein [Pseudomonas aeruginosa]KSD80016.1 hypothetical protein AO903_00845 [Pseudomonas aeruginosa]